MFLEKSILAIGLSLEALYLALGRLRTFELAGLVVVVFHLHKYNDTFASFMCAKVGEVLIK